MKFRKKPVIIDAWLWNNNKRTFEELKEAGLDPASFKTSPSGRIITGLEIKTLEGTMTAKNGDWIIKGVNGEFYPCKPEIFEKTYEAVEIPAPPVGDKDR